MFLLPILVVLGLIAYVVLRIRNEGFSTSAQEGSPARATEPLRRVVVNRGVLVPLVALIGSIIVTNVVTDALIETHGPHADGHLASAQGAIPLIFVLAISFWTLGHDRRKPLLWVAALITVLGVGVVVAGNLHVVNVIGAEDSTTVAGAGAEPAGVEEGHDLASRGMLITQLGAIAFAVALVLANRVIGIGTAVASAAVSAVFPPWIIPGAGLIIAGAAVALRASRRERATAVARPASS